MPSGLTGTETLTPAARRAVFAGCIGFAVDFFDIYLPVLALAPVIAYFEPKGLSSAASTTVYFFTFAATLFGRPCGAIIFGHYADRIGRRRTTMVSIAGFGTLTFLIACLPGYNSLGVWALVLLIVLRFVDGVFMGGEYTSNNTLALEMVPKDRRGFVGGVLQGAFPIGFALVSAVTSFMFAVTTKQQYYNWGWRATFIFGALMAFAFLLYYRTVPESPMWLESEKSEAPLKEVFSGDHLRSLGQVFVMMLGFWFASQNSDHPARHPDPASARVAGGDLVRLPGRQHHPVLRLRRRRPAEPGHRPPHDDRAVRRGDPGRRHRALLLAGAARAVGRIGLRHRGDRGDLRRIGGVALGRGDHLHLGALPDPCACQRLRHRLQRCGGRFRPLPASTCCGCRPSCPTCSRRWCCC